MTPDFLMIIYYPILFGKFSVSLSFFLSVESRRLARCVKIWGLLNGGFTARSSQTLLRREKEFTVSTVENQGEQCCLICRSTDVLLCVT